MMEDLCDQFSRGPFVPRRIGGVDPQKLPKRIGRFGELGVGEFVHGAGDWLENSVRDGPAVWDRRG